MFLNFKSERLNFEFAVDMPKNAGRNRESTGKRKVSALENDDNRAVLHEPQPLHANECRSGPICNTVMTNHAGSLFSARIR
jgi:hypothetical protein